jgi:hypothetical protein
MPTAFLFKELKLKTLKRRNLEQLAFGPLKAREGYMFLCNKGS